jgi:uncharacterized protein (PEP-CTERM system associated)
LALAGLDSTARATTEPDYANDVLMPLPLFPVGKSKAEPKSPPKLILVAAETDEAPAALESPAPVTTAPTAPSPTNPVEPSSRGGNPAGPFSDLLGIVNQGKSADTPVWLIVPHVGLDEIARDVETSHGPGRTDLISLLSAGVTLSGDAPRFQGLLSYTGTIRHALANKNEDRVTQYGTASGHATIFPDLLFVDLSANAHELARLGNGIPNPALLSNSDSSQLYTASVSPHFRDRVGEIGFFDARYSYSRLWVQRNTGPVDLAGFTIAPLSDSTLQSARAEFQMPGVIDARLLQDFSLHANSIESGSGVGRLRKAAGEFINEYQLTRSLSTIAEVGYESLSDPQVPAVNGQGVTWSGGGRWRPNIDSSILLLYGRHDLKTDIGAEVQWRLTPATTLFAAYTDSLTTSQATLLGNNQSSLPGVDGPALGVTFEDDPLIAILDDPSLGPNREQQNGAAAGVPLLEADNFNLHQNGLFRSKLFRSTLTSDLADGSTVTLTAFHLQRIALVGERGPAQLTNQGIRATWAPVITEDVTGRVEAGVRTDEIAHGKTYNLGLAANYRFSETFNGGLRYDFLVHEVGTGSQGSTYTNALTLTLRKTF